MNSLNRDVYAKEFRQNIERLLSNMDRNVHSDSYGCLARPFWHDKVTDFPSMHQQIGVLPLALAYTQDFEDNPFKGSEEIKDLIDAGISFWAQEQKRNGSFDEHYPNEHSLGAVSWTLWAVTEACLLLDDYPDIEDEVDRAIDFIEKNDEPGDIANHQAVTASALINCQKLVGRGEELAEERLQQLEEMQSEEGWFQEYVGADIGYQSTTISHLGRVYRRSDLLEDEIVESALEFFSSFIDEEGYYSGVIGSRGTDHLHAAGFEILADEFDEAEKIAAAIRKNREEGNLLEPSIMDDKHFSRQLAEYMDAYRYADSIEQRCPEISDRDYETVSIRKKDSRKHFVNTSKSGTYLSYEKGELVDRSEGISVERKGPVYTGNWPGVTREKQAGEEEIVLEGELREVPRGTMPGGLFFLSRIFNYTAGRSKLLSLTAKDFLIDLLIGSSSEGVRFKRTIQIGEEISVEDEADGKRLEGKARPNFVPSSEFFRHDRLIE